MSLGFGVPTIHGNELPALRIRLGSKITAFSYGVSPAERPGLAVFSLVIAGTKISIPGGHRESLFHRLDSLIQGYVGPGKLMATALCCHINFRAVIAPVAGSISSLNSEIIFLVWF